MKYRHEDRAFLQGVMYAHPARPKVHPVFLLAIPYKALILHVSRPHNQVEREVGCVLLNDRANHYGPDDL